MKVTVLLLLVVVICLTWLQSTEAQREICIPPKISSIIPEKMYMAPKMSGIDPWKFVVPYTCDNVQGIPKPMVYWQYFRNGVLQGKLYPDARHETKAIVDGVLKLKMINPQEQFQCVAKNRYGTALSTKIQLIEAQWATFDSGVEQAPFKSFGTVGKSILMPCEYTRKGIPDAGYSWRYLGQTSDALQKEDRIFISQNGSLVFSYLKLGDGSKTYRCNIENKILNLVKYGGWTKLEVTGDTAGIPDSPPSLIYSTENNTVAFYKKPFKMQCIFGGKPVPEIRWEPRHTQNPRFSVNSNNEFIISSVEEEDERFYTCITLQKLGNPISRSIFIDVKGPPIWVQKPESLIVAEGQDGVFHCNARPLKGERSLSKPSWFKNGDRLNIAPGGVQGRTELSADGKTLTIHDALKRTDICNYQCSVANKEGEIFADAAFNVILNTEVLVAPQSYTIDKGEVVTFDIKVTTDPLKEKVLSYKWNLNGRKIEFLDLSDIYILPNNSLVVNTTEMDDNRYQLVLGNYSVEISNEVEIVTRYASLMGNPVKKPVVSESGMDLGWIALIVAVVLLFIIFILLLCVLFNRHSGDDYSVDKKERKAGHDPEKELADSGFHDLPRTDDDPDRQKPDNVSISSTAKSMGSETDSMEEYSDADAGSRFNEDGSFIGAYQGHESKGNVSNV